MTYISQNRNINKDNLLYLYQTLTNDIDMNRKKSYGSYYRLADAHIANRDKGIHSSLINSYMKKLIIYLKKRALFSSSPIVITIATLINL